MLCEEKGDAHLTIDSIEALRGEAGKNMSVR
jgi:hypothetical protein